jgi:plastocyanin
MVAFKVLVVALAALASVSVFALGSGQEEMAQADVGTPVSWTVDGTPVHTANSVAIVDTADFFAFEPEDVIVPVGGTVIWENLSTAGEGHTVASTDESSEVFVSSEPDPDVSLKEGQSFSHTFETAGSFPYICGIHPDMTGTVIVGP